MLFGNSSEEAQMERTSFKAKDVEACSRQGCVGGQFHPIHRGDMPHSP